MKNVLSTSKKQSTEFLVRNCGEFAGLRCWLSPVTSQVNQFLLRSLCPCRRREIPTVHRECWTSSYCRCVFSPLLFIVYMNWIDSHSWVDVGQRCSGAETRRNGVSTPFSGFALKWVWSCFKMASFLGAFTHLFYEHYIPDEGATVGSCRKMLAFC